jgi:hypothetical protein
MVGTRSYILRSFLHPPFSMVESAHETEQLTTERRSCRGDRRDLYRSLNLDASSCEPAIGMDRRSESTLPVAPLLVTYRAPMSTRASRLCSSCGVLQVSRFPELQAKASREKGTVPIESALPRVAVHAPELQK